MRIPQFISYTPVVKEVMSSGPGSIQSQYVLENIGVWGNKILPAHWLGGGAGGGVEKRPSIGPARCGYMFLFGQTSSKMPAEWKMPGTPSAIPFVRRNNGPRRHDMKVDILYCQE